MTIGEQNKGLIALLFAYHGSSADDGEPLASLSVAGLTSIERQVRQARLAGAMRTFVLAERMPARLAAALERAQRGGPVEILRSPAELAGRLGNENILVLDEGVVADQRIVAAVVGTAAPAIAIWVDSAQPPGAERLDATRFAAGIALYSASLVKESATAFGDWDLQGALLRAASARSETTAIDLGALDLYAPDRRRLLPLLWRRPETTVQAIETEVELIAAAQKGCLDWPARFLHPPVENWLVRLLLPTAVTPNQVTALTGVVGFAATAAFATGWLWAGLLLALAIGPLDGVDGKLARTRIEFSRWGDLEHVLDKLVEYSWYAALAWHFGGVGAWALAAIIILFALAEALQGEFFRRFTGRQLDDAGPFERRFRLVGGRRNTFFWALVPFALADAWGVGFGMIAAYSAATFFVAQARFFLRLGEYGRSASAQVAANFGRTAYAFLSAPETKAR